MKQFAVYCPNCGKHLISVSQFQTIEVIKRCECGNYYKVDPLTLRASKTNKPERTTSSGVTFY